MMGLSAAMTAAAFEPRKARISAASLVRSRQAPPTAPV